MSKTRKDKWMLDMEGSGYRIAVIGLWHLGEVYSAGLAHLGHKVVGISDNKTVVENLLRGIPPLAEPRLVELIGETLQKGLLTYSHDMKPVENCNVIWLTFDTPVNDRDESDLRPILKSVREASPYLKDDSVVVVSSQVPAGTFKTIGNLIRKLRPNLKFHYVYSPENLRLGDAVNCFLSPGRIVVGADDNEGFQRIKSILSGINADLLRMSPASAEMAKHALNAFLATSVSFINDIADACEKVGADILDVTKALRSDERIGQRAFLDSGLGFSGGTLGRDLVALRNIGRKHRSDLPVVESVLKKNQLRPKALVGRLEFLLGGVTKKRITILGLTYKAGTSTLRRSRSLEIASVLIRKGALLNLCDPHVVAEELPQFKNADAVADPYLSACDSEALLFLTPWKDFRELNFGALAKSAKHHAIVFDPSNFLQDKKDSITESGFLYYGVGR
jgi:UDPglucose 6-dehydrogenase